MSNIVTKVLEEMGMSRSRVQWSELACVKWITFLKFGVKIKRPDV